MVCLFGNMSYLPKLYALSLTSSHLCKHHCGQELDGSTIAPETHNVSLPSSTQGLLDISGRADAEEGGRELGFSS